MRSVECHRLSESVGQGEIRCVVTDGEAGSDARRIDVADSGLDTRSDRVGDVGGDLIELGLECGNGSGHRFSSGRMRCRLLETVPAGLQLRCRAPAESAERWRATGGQGHLRVAAQENV